MKFRRLLGVLVVVLVAGCSKEVEGTNTSSNYKESTTDALANREEEPPELRLTIGGEDIKTYKGTYSWSYIDKDTGDTVHVEADHASPNQMLTTERAIPVNLTQPVMMKFEEDPTDYEVRLWDSKTVIATYDSFEEVSEKGAHIVEVIAYWGENEATYVMALDIQ